MAAHNRPVLRRRGKSKRGSRRLRAKECVPNPDPANCYMDDACRLWCPPRTASPGGPPITRSRYEQELRADMAALGLSTLPPDTPVCNCPQGEQCVSVCGPFGHLCKWKCGGGDSGWSWKKIGKRI